MTVRLGNEFGPKIVAIGGAVVKTRASEALKDLVRRGEIKALIHNGGSIFHDFQIATEPEVRKYASNSYPLSELSKDYSCNRAASMLLWGWIRGEVEAPIDSLTRRCTDRKIPVLMFTALGCDFWQLYSSQWSKFAYRSQVDFQSLCHLMKEPFHYICMGSAVIHPEVFAKAFAVVKPEPGTFRADVVDFLDMYRPRTRVAKYGHYYQVEHCDFTKMWLEETRNS